MKKVIVISLGGSLIVPDDIDINLLKQFKKTILKNTKEYKFIIVCGGGSTARKYISALGEFNLPQKTRNLIGMQSTRLNAQLVASLFNPEPSEITAKEEETGKIKGILKRHDYVFIEGGKYQPQSTSDSGSALLSRYFKTDFINLTNVTGLYDKNPKEHKDARFFPEISWQGLHKMATRNKFTPGQHFVIDQTASKIILDNKITTYILGKNLKNLDNLLNGKKFTGTIVQG